MPEINLRDLQAGQTVSLEGCGLVTAAHVDHQTEWVEVTWISIIGDFPRRADPAKFGTWSALYDDVPTVWAFEIEETQ